MATQFRHDGNGAASTNLSATTPTTGGAYVLTTGSEATVNGSGIIVGGSTGYYDNASGFSFGDGTIKMRVQAANIFAGDLNIFFRAQGSSVWNVNGYALYVGYDQLQLVRRLPGNATGTVYATFSGTFSGAFTDLWLRFDGARCRVWVGTNVGTPDIDVSTLTEYSSGQCGLQIAGSTAQVDFIDIDDAPTSPSAPVYDKNDNQDPRRILRRVTRSRLFRAA